MCNKKRFNFCTGTPNTLVSLKLTSFLFGIIRHTKRGHTAHDTAIL